MKKFIYIIFALALTPFVYSQATLNGNMSFNGKNFRITTVYTESETAYEIKAMHEGQEYITKFIPNPALKQIKILSQTPSGNLEHSYSMNEVTVEENLSTEGLMARKTEETKTIAGVTCTKILAQTKNGNQAEIWYYDNGFPIDKYKDIYKSDIAVQSLSALGLNGIPMEVQLTNAEGYSLMSISTREFSKTADSSFLK